MLRIAFDLDGTLADLDSALDRIAGELFPAPQSPSGPGPAGAPGGPATEPGDRDALTAEEERLEPPEVRALTRRQQHQIWERVRRTTNFWETLDEAEPGIVARLAALAEERRWEVLFLTQRPAAGGDTTQHQSQRWLATRGFDLPSVYVLGAGASRGKVAAALSLDVVVDDRPENCLDVTIDSSARVFLVARQTSGPAAANARHTNIEVVQTVGECLDILSAGPRGKAGLLGRLKKVFGTSEPA